MSYALPPEEDHPFAVFMAWMAVILLIVTMSACAPRPQVVGIPTPVPCRVTLPETPTFSFDLLEPGSDVFTQMKTLLADRRERIADRRVIVAAAESCR